MKELLLTAVHAALLAGERILEIYKGGEVYHIDFKADDSPLTLADSESHRIISEVVQKEKPAIPLLSEEGADLPFNERKNWQRLWIIDPLDGTKEFINKNGEFTVNIALIEEGAPRLGVIYEPVKGNLYFASQGEGAFKAVLTSHQSESYNSKSMPDQFMNQAAVIMANQTALKDGRPIKIVSSRSHLNEETEDYINTLQKRYGKIELISAGSSLKICQVAEGKADIYPRLAPTMEWDTAAGNAIAIEAGCSMTEADSKENLLYNKENLRNPDFIVQAPWIEEKNDR